MGAVKSPVQYPESAVFAAFLIAATACVVIKLVQRSRFGRKQIDYFKLTGVPAPTPLLDFEIREAKARPYRPFRWAYHQTMALKKLEQDYWLELEASYAERIAQRKGLYERHGKSILQVLPGSEEACKELVEMVVQWLCVRYPKQFQFDLKASKFKNHILETEDIVADMKPLMFLLNNVPEDFLLVQEDKKTGLYLFTAGVACSAMGWDIGEKIGKPLKEIHQPVPDYKEKLEFSVDRFFSKLACDKPIQRGSWSLEIGQPLFIPLGDPHFTGRDTQRKDITVEDLHLRVDWQTLRRLPQTKAIVFNYKALFNPVTDFRNEPYIPKLIAKVMREGKKNILEYKSTYHIEHVMLPALDSWSKEQEEQGLVPNNWEARTLDEDPFFPGWEKKYRSKLQ